MTPKFSGAKQTTANKGAVCEDVELIAASLLFEVETGADSIPTIERVYERTDSGAYRCCWPECQTVRHDPAKLWHHIHKSAPHHTTRVPR